MNLISLLFVLCLTTYSVDALRCYTCTATEEDEDQSCITDPDAVQAGSAITNCNKKYCTSMRVEYLDPKNVVQSMYRSCEENPQNMNDVMEDGTFRIYFRACQEDLCNGGSGKDTSSGSINRDVGEALVILVPGVGASSTVMTSVFLILLSQTFLLLYVQY